MLLFYLKLFYSSHMWSSIHLNHSQNGLSWNVLSYLSRQVAQHFIFHFTVIFSHFLTNKISSKLKTCLNDVNSLHGFHFSCWNKKVSLASLSSKTLHPITWASTSIFASLTHGSWEEEKIKTWFNHKLNILWLYNYMKSNLTKAILS